MVDRFDLVVIGAGSAGLSAASFAARIGARVALVERDRIGGDCTWRGCVPSKALLRIGGTVHAMRRADAYGLPLLDQSVDLPQVMAEVRRAVERVYQFETPAALAKQGITVIRGAARFLDPRRLAVDGQTLAGRRFIICTGARPAIPPVPGLPETPHLTYETVFALSELPRRLLVLGAGPVGAELAQAFRRLGSHVVLIEQADRVLPIADPEASAALGEREARARGERVVVHRWPIERIDRAQTAGEGTGFLKLLARPNGILTGATVVGSAAGELINELALAVDRRLTLADLAATIHAYPTYGFAIQQVSAEATIARLADGWRGRLIRFLIGSANWLKEAPIRGEP